MNTQERKTERRQKQEKEGKGVLEFVSCLIIPNYSLKIH